MIECTQGEGEPRNAGPTPSLIAGGTIDAYRCIGVATGVQLAEIPGVPVINRRFELT
jgi:hypothetical protein